MTAVLQNYTLVSAVGCGRRTHSEALQAGRSGLRRNDFPGCTLDTWIGRVPELDHYALGDDHVQWQSRNNALAALTLEQDGLRESVQQAADMLGADRIGVVLGTSTSSIGETEEAYQHLQDEQMPADHRRREIHHLHSTTDFVAHWLDISGPTMTISTACSSSAKVFATADRWLESGLVDAVLVGGVDTLCLTVLYGFNSLELVSDDLCRPFDQRRKGINIGEAGGFALLRREGSGLARLLGYGESSDAYHMSHPHPEGRGARQCMSQALKRASLNARDIDYINLHGTASKANDAIEAAALGTLFSESTAASSTKGWTGHTLGAAGIVEALLALEALRGGFVPGPLNLEQPDELAFAIVRETRPKELAYVMTNSFGFGGNNASLVFGKCS